MKKTTFIIGAGASADFGMPIGEGLIRTIVDIANVSPSHGRVSGQEFHHAAARALKNYWGDQYGSICVENLKKISSGLWLSASIDNFLNEQDDDPDLQLLSKQLISLSILYHERTVHHEGPQGAVRRRNNSLWNILPREGRGRVRFEHVRETWLVWAFRQIRGQASLDAFLERIENTLFVIFNYDRIFEVFFEHALRTFDGLEGDELANVLDRLRIVHPYGSIGAVWEHEENVLKFGDHDPNAISNAIDTAERIQTFGEKGAGVKREETQIALAKSDSTVFLGFGFLDQNMRYLGRDARLKSKVGEITHVYATVMNISDYRQKKIAQQLASFCSQSKYDGAPLTSKVRLIDGIGSDAIREFGDEWF